MNRLISWLKSIRLERIVAVFLASILLMVTTACNNGVQAKTADDVKASNLRKEVPSGAVSSPYEGGMNDYSDVDPRKNSTEANAKAKGLVDNAQRNIDEKSIDSPEQYVENYRSGTPLDQRVRNLGEDIGESAKDVTNQAAKGQKENARNIQNATQSAANKADQASNAATSKANEAAKNVQGVASDAGEKAENLGDKIKRAAQNTADALD